MVEHSPRSVGRLRVGVSEAVADLLRRRLLSGAHHEGELLPKQQDLMEEYGVSKAALREALRILETEGLLEVRRGNVGGAVVRIPQPEGAAYTLALVLQARQVPFSEVGGALRHLEPVCAGLCAARKDRKRAVVPSLRAAQRDLRRATQRDDTEETLAASRQFHETLVSTCGNETLIVLVGTLEGLWTTNARVAGESAAAAGYAHDPALRIAAAEAHDEIIGHIVDGNVDLTIKAARVHLETARLHAVALSTDLPVEATAVRDHNFRAGLAKNPKYPKTGQNPPGNPENRSHE
jgi:GntR family transcriptional repressor for pyruvate dehydrogenase complex